MTPQQAHEIYLKTAKERGWPVKAEIDRPYSELCDDAKALDIAFANACNEEVKQEREDCAKVADAIKGISFLYEARDLETNIPGSIVIPENAYHASILIGREIRARGTNETLLMRSYPSKVSVVHGSSGGCQSEKNNS